MQASDLSGVANAGMVSQAEALQERLLAKQQQLQLQAAEEQNRLQKQVHAVLSH